MPATPYVKTREISNRLYGRPTERSYVLANDLVYCITGEKIHCFDVNTGKHCKTVAVPDEFQQEAKDGAGYTVSATIRVTGKKLTIQPIPYWTEVRLWQDRLIAKVGKRLIAVDRHTGKLLWARKSALEYTTYALGDNTLYALDCDPDDYRKPRDQVEKKGQLFALDLASGKELWKKEIEYLSWPNVVTQSVVAWMKPAAPFVGYNAKHNLVIIAYNGNNIIALEAKDGSQLWALESDERNHLRWIYTPNILDGHLMLSLSKYQGGMGYLVDIRTGKKLQEENQVPRARTCGRLIGNQHLLTYRDAATEIYDMDSDRTIPFNSMRAGCTTSLIPANGVLSAPMLSHGCVCNYPMFASLALYHMPGSESMRPKAVQQSWERK